MTQRLDFSIVELLAAGYNARGDEVAQLATELLELRERHPEIALPPGAPWRVGRRRGRHVYRADLEDDAPDADVATFINAADAATAVSDRTEVPRLRALVADLRDQLARATGADIKPVITVKDTAP